MDMSSGGRISDSGARTGHTHAADEVDALPLSAVQDAGDLIVGDGPAAWARVAVGDDGTALTAASGQPGGMTWTAVAAAVHTHTQAQSHDSPDTDTASSALHHTLGTGANQAAAGNHTHENPVPVGALMPYVGTTAPAGWLLCDGSVKSASEYPVLAVVCGSLYGTAGQGLFVLPNLQGRAPYGYTTGTAEFNAMGKSGGSVTSTLVEQNLPSHTHTTPSHQHTAQSHDHAVSVANEASHTHDKGSFSAGSGSDGTHGHTGGSLNTFVTSVASTVGNNTTTGGGAARVTAISTTSESVTVYVGTSGTQGGHSHAFSGVSGAGSSHGHTATAGGAFVTLDNSGSGVSGATGSGMAVPTVSPYLVLQYIIKAG